MFIPHITIDIITAAQRPFHNAKEGLRSGGKKNQDLDWLFRLSGRPVKDIFLEFVADLHRKGS